MALYDKDGRKTGEPTLFDPDTIMGWVEGIIGAIVVGTVVLTFLAIPIIVLITAIWGG